jgi:hypothetical protein
MIDARNLYKKHGGERIVRQEIFLKKNERMNEARNFH